MARYLWLDTETTGLETKDSGAFEYAFILVDSGKVITQRLFHLNPLQEGIIAHKEALEVNGTTEEEIKAFQSEKEGATRIAEFIKDCFYLFDKSDTTRHKKLILAGYNVAFDAKFLSAMLKRQNISCGCYFEKGFFDVLEEAKKARSRGLLQCDDLHLTTVAKSLNVSLENAHTALADITATREVATKLYYLNKKNQGAGVACLQ